MRTFETHDEGNESARNFQDLLDLQEEAGRLHQQGLLGADFVERFAAELTEQQFKGEDPKNIRPLIGMAREKLTDLQLGVD